MSEPSSRYDLVVIGAGPAGLVAAAGAAGLGARVALVERHKMGGDCLNYGCVPSKALLRAARAAAAVREAPSFGVRVEGARVDFPAVMERLRRVRDGIAVHDSPERFRGLGVEVFLGEASFANATSVAVPGKTLEFRKALIATGARAAPLPIPGLSETGFLTNESVFSLESLPARLAVIGAGPVGCELAQAFARLGAQVVLLEALPRILPREHEEAARRVRAALERDGVTILAGAKIERVSSREASGKREKTISLEQEGSRREIVADEVLAGVGRAPNHEGLGLERAGVAFDKSGVHVDDFLRTTNRRVLAAGDICSPLKFTHAADAMARIAIQNALFPGRKRVSALTVPWCTYTDPEVAHVGLHERNARERGIEVQAFTEELRDVDRAVIDGESEGFVEVLVRRGTDRILGATIVAAHAGEMISEITLAIVGGLGLGTIAGTIHPYPTQAEALKRAGDAYNRTRLTPFVAGLAKKWLAWSR